MCLANLGPLYRSPGQPRIFDDQNLLQIHFWEFGDLFLQDSFLLHRENGLCAFFGGASIPRCSLHLRQLHPSPRTAAAPVTVQAVWWSVPSFQGWVWLSTWNTSGMKTSTLKCFRNVDENFAVDNKSSSSLRCILRGCIKTWHTDLAARCFLFNDHGHSWVCCICRASGGQKGGVGCFDCWLIPSLVYTLGNQAAAGWGWGLGKTDTVFVLWWFYAPLYENTQRYILEIFRGVCCTGPYKSE